VFTVLEISLTSIAPPLHFYSLRLPFPYPTAASLHVTPDPTFLATDSLQCADVSVAVQWEGSRRADVTFAVYYEGSCRADVVVAAQ